ncbi:MAG TPA: hypothetical protein VFB20_16455 [Burkholderiales bacterium]|nr:hypothetical protein [Burkholderiales bacterium]
MRREIAANLARGDETAVRSMISQAPSERAARLLAEALDAELAPPRAEVGVQVRVFTIPVLFVAGAMQPTTIPGVVPDMDEIRQLFEQAGALGPAKNFGLSNALTSPESLEAVPWTLLHRIAHGKTEGGLERMDLPPAELALAGTEEHVHLRFVAGAALTPADAPSFVETAGDIGRWGVPFTRMLARQLAVPGATLLPIPRPPATLARAPQQGRFAGNELGFQLFLSNALRRARMRFGDPGVTVAAYSDATVRVRLTSPFDAADEEEYRWPLRPEDALDEVANSIFGLLAEVRLDRVEVPDTVVSACERG